MATPRLLCADIGNEVDVERAIAIVATQSRDAGHRIIDRLPECAFHPIWMTMRALGSRSFGA